MRGRAILACCAMVLLLLVTLAGVARAGGAETSTVVQNRVTMVDPHSVNPCTGDPGTMTGVANIIMHITEVASGGVHVTSTLTSSLEFTPNDPTKEAFTGHFTISQGGNFNPNNGVLEGTFIIRARAMGTQGSVITFQGTAHTTVIGTEVIVQFMDFSMGCP